VDVSALKPCVLTLVEGKLTKFQNGNVLFWEKIKKKHPLNFGLKSNRFLALQI
jgi:hypothetical protein